MTPLGRTARLVAVAAFSSVLFLVSGCGSDVQGTAIASSDTADTTARSTTARTTTAAPSDTTDIDRGGEVDIDVEIGQCVELGGTVTDATIDNAICGSPQSNYVVIGKAPTSDECIADADQYYYETLRDVEQGALCLDIDWQVGGCMELSGEDPQRVDCATPGSMTERVVDIVQGTADVDDCPDPATYGYTKDVRNFVVCVEEL